MFFPLVIIFVSILKLCPALPFEGFLEAATEEASPRNGSTRSGCPEWDELPRVWNKKFIAARKYNDEGHDIPALSCNGNMYEPVNGYQVPRDTFGNNHVEHTNEAC